MHAHIKTSFLFYTFTLLIYLNALFPQQYRVHKPMMTQLPHPLNLTILMRVLMFRV